MLFTVPDEMLKGLLPVAKLSNPTGLLHLPAIRNPRVFCPGQATGVPASAQEFLGSNCTIIHQCREATTGNSWAKVMSWVILIRNAGDRRYYQPHYLIHNWQMPTLHSI